MAGLDLSISSRANNSLLLSPDKSDMDESPYKSSDSTSSTPRKNKRKSSEPKRRSDFSIKRFCPDTPHALSHGLDTEDGGGRPGYGEHPPSTPETSASSSTPSPPDVTQLRIPQIPRHHGGLTSPLGHGASSSPSPEAVTSHALPRQPASFLPPYASALNMPYGLPMNPLLLQHMIAMQQQPGGISAAMQQQLAMAAAAAANQIPPRPPAPPSTQQPSAAAAQRPIPVPHAASHRNSHPPKSETVSRAPANPGPSRSTAKSAEHSNSKPSSSKAQPNSKSRAQTASNRSSSQNVSRTSNDSSLNLSTSQTNESLCPSDNDDTEDFEGGRRSRKNYKNMTRERRIEANARERSRVHTISAAFETLRRTVPSFSHTQRLSKLAILRIACSYISALASVAGEDYSYGGDTQESFADSVDECTKTIQNEGRAKRRH